MLLQRALLFYFFLTLLIFKTPILFIWWSWKLHLLIQLLHGVSRHYTNDKTLFFSKFGIFNFFLGWNLRVL